MKEFIQGFMDVLFYGLVFVAFVSILSNTNDDIASHNGWGLPVALGIVIISIVLTGLVGEQWDKWFK